MKERSGASPLDPAQRAVLQAAIGSPETPDYALIRAVAALDDGETRRMGRLTAMGRPFVTGARRTIRERGASALLDDPPSPQERLLDVATARIRAGHADFAMREIEREAEIPHRTVYNAYTKTALVQACRRRAQTVWRTRYERRVLLAHQDPAATGHRDRSDSRVGGIGAIRGRSSLAHPARLHARAARRRPARAHRRVGPVRHDDRR